MDNGVVVYGAGRLGQRVLELLQGLRVKVKAVLDRDEQIVGTEIYGYIVETPEALMKYRDALLYIAVADSRETDRIRKRLRRILGHDIKHEISYHGLILDAFEKSYVMEDFLVSLEYQKNNDESVLFCCPNGLILGGVETWTLDICKALIASGLQRTYIIAKSGVRSAYELSSDMENHIIYVIDNGFRVESVKEWMKIIAARMPCKLVLAFPDSAMLAAHLLKRKYHEQVSTIRVIHGGKPDIYKICMDVQKCVSVHVAVSKDIRREMIRRGMGANKVYSVTLPFSCGSTVQRSYTLDALGPLRLGYAGRFENEQKRMDLILRLIHELANRNVKFVFNFAGTGTAREEMEAYLETYHCSSFVHFEGKIQREKIRMFWEQQDICVNMADYEGRSISICEAMGSGVVPVVTDTSGVREDILDGENGYIVPVGDYLTAADRIEFICNHRECLPEMGRLAHDAVYPKSLMEPHVKFWRELLLRENGGAKI